MISPEHPLAWVGAARGDPAGSPRPATSARCWLRGLNTSARPLLSKCESLDGAALVLCAVPPSSLSLLGLVRHMTYVEWHWFDHVFAGVVVTAPISLEDDLDTDFNDLRPETALADVDHFLQRCDVSRAIVAAADSLDVLAIAADPPNHLRWIMIHRSRNSTSQRACRPPARTDRRVCRGVSAGVRRGGPRRASGSITTVTGMSCPCRGRACGADQRRVAVPPWWPWLRVFQAAALAEGEEWRCRCNRRCPIRCVSASASSTWRRRCSSGPR